MSFLQPDAFASRANFYNITRNFAFIGIMAIGMVAVIITGGIDLSVGSIMGLVGVVCGVLLQAGYHLVGGACSPGSLTGMAAGAVNGAPDRLCRPLALRRDARHALLRALVRDRAVAEQDDLRIRPLRRDLQGHRRRPVPRPVATRSGC